MSSCYRQHVPRCLIFLLDRYFWRLPKYMFEQDIFYLRPKSFIPASGDKPWYECVAIGKNSLCQEAGIEEKTNPSLRATGTMSVFQANVSERVIQKQLDIDLCKLYDPMKSFSSEKWRLHNLALSLLTLCGLLHDQNVLQVTLENCLVVFSTAQLAVLLWMWTPLIQQFKLRLMVRQSLINLMGS